MKWLNEKKIREQFDIKKLYLIIKGATEKNRKNGKVRTTFWNENNVNRIDKKINFITSQMLVRLLDLFVSIVQAVTKKTRASRSHSKNPYIIFPA